MNGVLKSVRLAGALAAAAGLMLSSSVALAQQGKIKIGLMLPYTGTFAALGTAITNGFKLAIDEQGGKLGGREIEYFTVDDESDPAKAPDNANKLIKRDNVDVLVGTVHSGVAMAMAKVAKETGTLLIVPVSFATFAIAIATPECTVPTITSTLSRLISLLTLSVAFDGSDSSSTLKYWISRPPSLPPCSCT